MTIRVTVWNEYRHELEDEKVGNVYPRGIHGAIAEGLEQAGGFEVRTATLDEPLHGLSDDVIANTDVFIWWGHIAHDDVSDEVVAKVHQRILDGAGLIVLHSGHYSKVFRRLMGTGCDVNWREADERERIWVVSPNHPIVEGIGDYIELPQEEMYGEHFDIPAPDELIFVSWFQGGEVFRSGATFTRTMGKIFYFRPGHETYPTYYNDEIRRVIANAVRWAKPIDRPAPTRDNRNPIETLEWYDPAKVDTVGFGASPL